ncbi:GntR family transcriptional regulator [Agromyces badenianii]|uniref:GntR family transcriptional regulator n=1 Tax=Agromyces badenianii TaxID=2080742 RepID=A0A2S0WT02_9MICO|nr:GntR family transcriptional regulator [Agromyces badenianii]AWB94420.1 GntR family transcriptional regulator [Agromyces badenianii]
MAHDTTALDAAPAPAAASDAPRAWRTVLEHIETQLLEGALRPGDRLPGERALSAELGVGRSSVREALRVLEVLGLIRTAAGSGPSSGAIIIATPGGGMSALMRLQVAASGFPVSDIVRTRLILETSVAGDLAEAGRRASAESDAPAAPDLAPAQRLLDAMDSPNLAPTEFLALDAAFHLALAEASGNQVITATMAGLRSGIEGYALEGLAAIADWPATCARLRTEHRGILEAIRALDAATARTRTHDHISGYYAETFIDTSPR